MIKNFYILLFSIFILISIVGYSQDMEKYNPSKNSISLNLIEFYNYTFEISYQRLLLKNQGAYISFGTTYRKEGYLPKSGYSFEFQYRFGLTQEQKFQYFVGPFIKYQFIKAQNPQTPILITTFGIDYFYHTIRNKTFFPGIIFGTIYHINNRVCLEFYSGLGMKFSSITPSLGVRQSFLDYIGHKNGPGLNAGLNFSFKF